MSVKPKVYNRKRHRVDRWEVITRNDDFTDRKTDVPYLLRTHRPAIVGTQESKFTDYRKELRDERYHIAQDTSTPARQGVAVIIDTEQVGPVPAPTLHRVLIEAKGLLPRGVTWTHTQLDGRSVVVASAHRPPQRNSDDWPAFDRALTGWIRDQSIPVILCMDSNVPGNKRRKKRELKALARRYNMRARGAGLDAVFINRDLRFASAARAYRKLRSDHRPVGSLLRWKMTPAKRRKR